MTKHQFVQRVAAHMGLLFPDHIEPAVNAVFDAMAEALASNERVEIRGFGSFTARAGRARTTRNPNTGTPVEVPAKMVPFFVASQDLRRRVNKGSRRPPTGSCPHRPVEV